MPDRSALPPELRSRLDEEPDDVQGDLDHIWDQLSEDDVAPTDTDAAWNRLHARLQDSHLRGREERTSRLTDRPARSLRPSLRRRVLYIATLTVVATVALTVIGWSRPIQVAAGQGQVRFVDLPDGSRVSLNSGTTLRYRRNFQRIPFIEAEWRTVWLDGEAYFKVKHGQRPFRVMTHNAEVTVLGTRFGVRARSTVHEAATDVAVSRGRVRVMAQDSSAVELTMGERTRAVQSDPVLTVEAGIEVQRIAAWRSGGFVVRDLPLLAVLDEIERRYAVDVRWEGPSPGDDAVTLYLANPDGARDVLDDLSRAFGLTYRATSRGYVLSPGS